jgi:hypothetical protein
MPAQTPLITDELLEDEMLEGAALLLEGATLLDDALDGAMLLLMEDALDGATLLEDVTESQEPRSAQALLAAQPTPGS